jgi:ADP-heptose:LPS heptosyltransferase
MTRTLVYFKHGIGNLIMLTPAMQALASMDGSGKIDVIMSSEWNDSRRPAFDEFFELCPFVEQVVNYPLQQPTRKYKTYFVTGHAEHSAAFDYVRQQCTIFMNSPDWRAESLHETEYYMNIVRKMGYTGATPPQWVPVATNGHKFLKSNTPLIGLCNGTYSDRMAPVKQYTYFKEINEALRRYVGATTVKVGYGEELKDVLDADHDYVGELTFAETCGLMEKFNLLITTDTALMHAADALDIPQVVIFGGSLVSKNGPLSNRARVVTAQLQCQPCQKTNDFYNCPSLECLQQLAPGDVMAAVREVLSRS